MVYVINQNNTLVSTNIICATNNKPLLFGLKDRLINKLPECFSGCAEMSVYNAENGLLIGKIFENSILFMDNYSELKELHDHIYKMTVTLNWHIYDIPCKSFEDCIEIAKQRRLTGNKAAIVGVYDNYIGCYAEYNIITNRVERMRVVGVSTKSVEAAFKYFGRVKTINNIKNTVAYVNSVGRVELADRDKVTAVEVGQIVYVSDDWRNKGVLFNNKNECLRSCQKVITYRAISDYGGDTIKLIRQEV